MLTNPLVHLDAADPAYACRLLTGSAARDVAQPPVTLGRYVAGTCLDGGSYGLAAPGQTSGVPVALDVDRPCLLVCHPGAWCWGHWLLDMLPKIVLAEQHRPGVFTYALPCGIVDPDERPPHAPGYTRSVLDSLAAYGIGAGRILRVRPQATYRFSDLFDLDGVSGKHMHPGVLTAMRNLPLLDDCAWQDSAMTAMLRSPPSIRTLEDAASVGAALRSVGAIAVDPVRSIFADQVVAFAAGGVVVGDLGSNLAGMIYAPGGTGLVTLAPLGWDDDYFAKLFQRLDLHVADLRGPSLARPGETVSHASYAVTPQAVLQGVRAVQAAQRGAGVSGCVAGRIVARQPGPVLQDWDFTRLGNGVAGLGEGFSAPEDTGTWSLGEGCGLTLPVSADGRRAGWLELEGVSFVPPGGQAIRMLCVSANGVELTRMSVAGETLLHCPLPPGLLAGADWLRLAFSHPGSLSPASFVMSGDTRALGFMFVSVRLRAEAA